LLRRRVRADEAPGARAARAATAAARPSKSGRRSLELGLSPTLLFGIRNVSIAITTTTNNDDDVLALAVAPLQPRAR
jgi:hypothetical protein